MKFTYTYGDSNWGDKLTAYDGKPITYDAIGNPLTYDGWTYTWQHGRELASLSNDTNTYTYKYNEAGIRTRKTVNGVTTKYILDGMNVLFEITGNNIISYYYDENGSLLGLRYDNADYWYIKNLQGDIIGILNNAGTQVVSYTYDTWGKLISITGTAKDTVGVANPYRYRGYRYDTETGLYYLNSRYYNPEWGRFINADGILVEGILGSNLYAYCNNNPVVLSDPTGLVAGIDDATAIIGGIAVLLFTCCLILWMADSISGTATIDIPFEFSRPKTKAKTRTISETISTDLKMWPKNSEAPYRLAYVDKSTNNLVFSKYTMTLTETLILLGCAHRHMNGIFPKEFNPKLNIKERPEELQEIMNASKYWGIYTSRMEYALLLVWSLDPTEMSVKREIHKSGYYWHFHDSTHSFHVWYGDPYIY